MEIRTEPKARCPLCNREGRIVHDQITDRALCVPGIWGHRRCDTCQLIWLDPQPIPEDLGKCYPGNYYTHSADEDEPISFGRSRRTAMLRGAVLSGKYGYHTFRPAFPMSQLLGRLLGAVPQIQSRATYKLNEALAPWTPGGSVLDIGCGSGDYLRVMRALGWKVFGIEIDPVAADVARTRAGAEVAVGSFDSAQLPLNSFDAVVSTHCIEHVENPKAFLLRAAQYLRPGGFLFIQTPNYGSLASRVFGRDWYALDPPRHLNLLTPAALARIARESGLLRDVQVRTSSRRSRRELEHVFALRQTGNFYGKLRRTASSEIVMRLLSMLEKAGTPFFNIGEELELIAKAR